VISSLAAFAFQLPSIAAFLPSLDSTTIHDHDDQTLPQLDTTPSYDPTSIDGLISELDIPSARISHPDVVPILLRLVWALQTSQNSARTSHALTKLLDRLAATSYSNRAALSQAHVVRLVWDRLHPYLPSSSTRALPTPESSVLQKLMRQILEMGAPSDDMIILFRRSADTSGAGVGALGLLKGNPHARWPGFLALRGEAVGMDVKNVVGRGRGLFGNTGITMTVCFAFFLETIRPNALIDVDIY
jgi:hypothetical protein